MKSSLSLVLFAALVGGTTACSHAQTVHPVEAAQPAAPSQAVAATPVATTQTQAPPTAVSPNVAVSGDLAARCHLKGDETQEAPKFSYDQFQLLPEDRNVLSSIANCLMTGPLAGHAVKLIGRADPRGTEEVQRLGSARGARRPSSNILERLGDEASEARRPIHAAPRMRPAPTTPAGVAIGASISSSTT